MKTVADFIEFLKTLPQDHELFADYENSDNPEDWKSINETLSEGVRIVTIDTRELDKESKSNPRKWVVLNLY